MSLDITLEDNFCQHCNRGDWAYEANITHNLGRMAEEAGIYQALWHPDEVGITKASQLIPLLEKALVEMRADPARFKKFDSPNGWGLYVNFVPWLCKLLTACEQSPEAHIRVSR